MGSVALTFFPFACLKSLGCIKLISGMLSLLTVYQFSLHNLLQALLYKKEFYSQFQSIKSKTHKKQEKSNGNHFDFQEEAALLHSARQVLLGKSQLLLWKIWVCLQHFRIQLQVRSERTLWSKTIMIFLSKILWQ